MSIVRVRENAITQLPRPIHPLTIPPTWHFLPNIQFLKKLLLINLCLKLFRYIALLKLEFKMKIKFSKLEFQTDVIFSIKRFMWATMYFKLKFQKTLHNKITTGKNFSLIYIYIYCKNQIFEGKKKAPNTEWSWMTFCTTNNI